MSHTLSRHMQGNNEILTINNARASASLSLFGAHLLSFKPKSDGRERLWLSEKAKFDGATAIRGGIPICWPWFANRHGQDQDPLPAHGYVRTQKWQLIEYQETDQQTRLLLEPTDCHCRGFFDDVGVQLHISVSDSLKLRLITSNNSHQDIRFTCALHSYFAVAALQQTRLQGLTGNYQDCKQNLACFATPAEYKISGETDRIHLTDSNKVLITEPAGNTAIYSSGHDSIVVWNPGPQRAHDMADMDSNGYNKMLCVETAITQGQSLAPGKSHKLEQHIS